MPKQRSNLGKYFEKISDKTTRCLRCNKIVTNNNNTTNLRNHLKSAHHDIFLKLRNTAFNTEESVRTTSDCEHEASNEESDVIMIEPPEQPTASTSASASTITPALLSTASMTPVPTLETTCAQPRIIQTCLGSQFSIPTKTESLKLTQAIAVLLAMTGTSYSFVESEGWRIFMGKICPNYKVPSRTTFSENYIPKLYTETKECLRMLLIDVPYISLTTDGWTGCNGSQFISITSTYIDRDWAFKTIVLACRELNQSHTGEHIAALIKDVLREYNVDIDRVSAITTDRGSNMINAVKTQLRKPHIPCFAHVLNTLMQKLMLDPFVAEIVTKIKAIHRIFVTSSAAKRELKVHQIKWNLPLKKMPSSCQTRWWSELDQFQFVVEQEKALFNFCNSYANGLHQELGITTNDIKKLKIIINLSVELERMQTTLGSETDVTASLILPVLQQIEKSLSDIKRENITLAGIITFSNNIAKLFKDMKETYLGSEDLNCIRTSHLDMAKYLDSRFVRNNTDHAPMHSVIKLDVQHITQDFIQNIDESEPNTKNTNNLCLIFKDNDESQLREHHTIDREIEDFVLEKKLPYSSDVLLWWKGNKDSYPMLSNLARKYLCMTATSVPSERVFSAAGNVLTENRSSLTDEHVEQLVFLMKNKSHIRH